MPMTLTEKLKAIKATGKGIFVPYIMAGDHEKGWMVSVSDSLLEDLGFSSY